MRPLPQALIALPRATSPPSHSPPVPSAGEPAPSCPSRTDPLPATKIDSGPSHRLEILFAAVLGGCLTLAGQSALTRVWPMPRPSELRPPHAGSERSHAAPLTPFAWVQPAINTALPSSLEANKSTDLIDLNTADRDLLMTLPGIGPTLAERILEYRAAHGRFRNIEDLMRIRGIKDKTLAKVRPHVRIGAVRLEGPQG